MEIPPAYVLTQEMVSFISQIEAKKALLENINIPLQLINKFQINSLLKSSLYSAKIEGNKLKESDFNGRVKSNSDIKERIEVENIITALNYLRNKKVSIIDLNSILDLHKIIMKNILDDAGIIRTVPSAIFNQAGFPVYIPPAPSQISDLLNKLIEYINTITNENILIKAALSHMIFEKIHPFLDGNGRMGRLLYQLVLIKNNYHFNWLLSTEEDINEKKEEYYLYLDKDDATSFIEFSLDVLLLNINKTVDLIVGQKVDNKETLLLPRRKEILDLIRDHKLMSHDQIKRRFLKVSPRMIRYDLKKLEEKGFIVKIGSTRGALYSIK